MTDVFIRKYELTVSVSEDLNSNITSNVLTPDFVDASYTFNPKGYVDDTNSGKGYKDYLTKSNLIFKISDLQIEADIKYSLNKNNDGGGQNTIIKI